MTRRKGQGYLKEKEPGVWALSHDIGPDPQTGRRRQRRETFRGNRRQAEQRLRSLLQAVETQTYVEPTKQTFGLYLLDWLINVKPRTAPTTYRMYEEKVRRHIILRLRQCARSQLPQAHPSAAPRRALA